MNFGKTRIYLILFIIIGLAIIVFLSTQHYPSKLVMGGKTYMVDVSDSSYTQSKGYSGREPITRNEGMIFVFDTIDKHGFWMKDMKFSIDIIWMDDSYTINHIEKSVSPETYPKVFIPNEPGKYVLEVAAGEVDRLGVKIGDKVDFLDKNRI